MSILTDTSFSALEGKVSEQTLKGVADMGFSHMTEIQAKSIPPLLEGRLVVSARERPLTLIVRSMMMFILMKAEHLMDVHVPPATSIRHQL